MVKDIKKEVLGKIDNGKIKIKSKSWFHFIKIGLGCLVALLIILAIIVANYAIYIPKRSGAFRNFGPKEIPPAFPPVPWFLVIVAFMLIAIAIWIYKEYESGYKKNIALVLVVSTIFVLFLGFVLAFSGLNERLEYNPQMKRFHDWQQDSFGPRCMDRQDQPQR